MHAGRVVKLLKLRSKDIILGKQERHEATKSSDKLHFKKLKNAIFEDAFGQSELACSLSLHFLKYLNSLQKLASVSTVLATYEC